MNYYDATKPYKEKVLELIRSTWHTPYVEVTEADYPVLTRRVWACADVDHTDGIGTKGLLHWKHRTFKEAVQDALAMNLNDLLTVGAVPYKLQNHLMLPEDDHDAILQIVGELCAFCRAEKICVTGGETSIHHNLEGMELSLTVSGCLDRARVNAACDGDYVVGLPSSGPHSNGYTLLNSVMRNPPTTPTVIYEPKGAYDPSKCVVHALVHIAGGAYSRLKSVLRQRSLDLYLEPPADDFWRDVYSLVAAVSPDADHRMYTTFNCGFGMILCVPPETYKPGAGVLLGTVKRGDEKVRIKSPFTGKLLIL